MNFVEFFKLTTGDGTATPFPYQRLLAEGDWPDVLTVPTGLGKTAAVITGWLWRRLQRDRTTPRRLVYCLPMRVLVEQVLAVAQGFVERVTPVFAARNVDLPRVALVMGGEADAEWARGPEQPAIIVGTQDMLLSRALMRGYGMSRYRWPVEFAFLHTDALWVFDEVQLMGAGRVTSAQLEAFRRLPALSPRRPSRTLWVSATLRPDWLATVDFAPHLAGLVRLGLDADPSDPDTAHAVVRQRVAAPKALVRTETTLSLENTKAKAAAYARDLAAEIRAAHRPGTTSLVILNRVDRAQAVFAALRAGDAGGVLPCLLIHSRFRLAERRAHEQALQKAPGAAGRIVVATQAIEAGVDLTSATLFTELAPLASMVQRCGRCNRYGEEADARVIWIDMAEPAAQPLLALPYHSHELEASRQALVGLASASPQAWAALDLPGDDGTAAVLRRKDLLELFNTDPDLSGFDVDISPYVRDAEDTDVQVFWRTDPPPDAARPARDELCPVAVGRFRDFLKKRAGAFVWDGLDKRWAKLDPARIRPGLTIMLDSALGGYDPDLGFSADSKAKVKELLAQVAVGAGTPEAMADDQRSTLGCYVGLSRHLAHVETVAEGLCAALDEGDDRDAETDGARKAERAAVIRAARWHDVGKAHAVFQNAIVACPDLGKARPPGQLAKSACAMKRYERRFFRHELASALVWLAHGVGDGPGGAADPDLIGYLIAAHHGKVRLGIRALPEEREPDNPPDDRLFARGVWHGDELPEVDVGGKERLPALKLSLSVMALGNSAAGPSWAARTQRLLAEHGPFRLAWLEALVRIADWRASRAEQEVGDDDV